MTRQTVTDWGAAPWQVDAATSGASLPTGCDVAVVGAGFTGLSAAYHLARGGAHVCLLEATRIGAGASGRTGALALEGTAAGPLPGADDCLPFLERLTADAGIACDLRLPGCLELVRRLEADAVGVAVNAWTPTLLPLPLSVAPALTLAVCTGPLDAATREAVGLPDGLPFYTADLPYLWGRMLADGRLLLGAGLVFPDGGDVETLAIGSCAVAAALSRLETRVRGFHPSIAAAGITARWGGPIAFRHETLRPIVARHPDAPSVVVTGAYAGHGVALAPRVGAIVADALLHDRPLPAWGALTADHQTA
jgi:glycine/D-amino acid oxidase-like deaminating enzyme